MLDTTRYAQGNELEALCSARGLLARASDWLGFEVNAMTTVKGDALRIKTLLEHVGMVQREHSKLTNGLQMGLQNP